MGSCTHNLKYFRWYLKHNSLRNSSLPIKLKIFWILTILIDFYTGSEKLKNPEFRINPERYSCMLKPTRAYLGIWDLRPRGRMVERHHVQTILDKLRSYQVTIHQNIVTCGQNSKAAAFVSSLFVDKQGTDITRKDQDRDENMWIFIFINIQTWYSFIEISWKFSTKH